MFPNLIIASSIRQAEGVADWIARYDRTDSAPALPRIPFNATAWTSAESALLHLYHLRPKRIIIVDYMAWTLPEPGDFCRLVRTISVQRSKGAEVVWW